MGESGSDRKIYFNVIVLAVLLVVHVGTCGLVGVRLILWKKKNDANVHTQIILFCLNKYFLDNY